MIGLTAWLAPNPFGETSAFLLLHPRDDATAAQLTTLALEMGLAHLDGPSDIPRIGTDTLSIVLSDTSFQVRTADTVLVEHIVSADWLDAARQRSYIVLAMGSERMADEESSESVRAYLSRHDAVSAGIVQLA